MNGCGVGSIDDACFCDVMCFARGDCCEDVVAIGCQPGKAAAQNRAHVQMERHSRKFVTVLKNDLHNSPVKGRGK